MALGDAELGFTLRVKGGDVARAEVQATASGIESAASKASASAGASASSIFKTLELGRQQFLASNIAAAESAASGIVSNFIKGGQDAEKEVATLLNTVRQAHTYTADAAKSATDILIVESQKAIANAERVAASAGQAVAKAGSQISTAQQEAAGLTGKFSGLAAAAGPLALGLGAVGAATIGAGVALFELIKRASDTGAQLFDLSKKTGLNIESLGALKFAAEESGSSIDSASRAVVLFQKQLTSAELGSESARKLLRQLGIDVAASLQDPNVAIRQLAAALNGPMPEGFNKTTLAQKLMGRSGADLVSTFDRIGGSFDDFLDKARQAGVLLSGRDVQAAEEFRTTLAVLEAQIGALANKFALDLAPTVSRVLQGMSDDFVRHRETISAGSKAIVVAIGNQIAEYEGLLSILGRVAGASDQSPKGGLRAVVGGEDVEIPEGLSADDIGQFLANRRREQGQDTDPAGPPGGALPQSDAERARARASAERALQESLRASQTAAETAFQRAVAQAQETFKLSNDYVGFVADMKKAEAERWTARSKQFDAEIKGIRDRALTEQETEAGGKQVRQAQINAKKQEKLAAGEAFLRRMHELDDELTSKTLADIQLRNRRANELDQLRANEYVEIQRRAAEQGRISYVRAEENIVADQRESLRKRKAALEEEKAAAVGDAQAYGEISHELDVLKVQTEIFERSVSGRIAGALGEDGDKLIQKLEKILQLEKDIGDNIKPFRMLDAQGNDLIGGAGKYSDAALDGQTGPYVDPVAFTKQFGPPPPPNLEPWHTALNGLKGMAGDTFKSITQGFAQMVGSFAAGAAASGRSFGQIARTAIASFTSMALVQALMELAYGVAALTPWGMALYGPAAPHFKAAALLGAAAAAGFGVGALVGGGGGGEAAAGSAFSGSAFSQPGGDTARERDRTIREGRTNGAPDPNAPQPQPVAQVHITLQMDRDVLERKMVHIWRGMGPFRDKVLSATVGQPESI